MSEARDPSMEYQVKAAYIYNFTKFVYWSTQSQKSSTNPITIAIIGDGENGEILEILRKKQAEGYPILVKTITSDTFTVDDCQVVYIGNIASQSLPSLLKRLEGTRILTVSDISGFTGKGGMIEFYMEKGRVKIAINLDAVTNAKLQISAKLLEVARITYNGKMQ